MPKVALALLIVLGVGAPLVAAEPDTWSVRLHDLKSGWLTPLGQFDDRAVANRWGESLIAAPSQFDRFELVASSQTASGANNAAKPNEATQDAEPLNEANPSPWAKASSLRDQARDVALTSGAVAFAAYEQSKELEQWLAAETKQQKFEWDVLRTLAIRCAQELADNKPIDELRAEYDPRLERYVARRKLMSDRVEKWAQVPDLQAAAQAKVAAWQDAKRKLNDLANKIDALNDSGNAAVKLGKYAEARGFYEQVLAVDPTDYHALLKFADSFYSENRYSEAIAGFDAVLKQHPESADAYCWRGDSWHGSEKYDQALADYNRALKIDPQHVESYRMRGVSHGKLKAWQEALVDLTMAIQLSQGHPQQQATAYQNRGDVWLARQQELAAAADYVAAARLDAERAEDWVAAARIFARSPNLKLRDGRRALDYMDRAMATETDPPADWLAIVAAAYAALDEPSHAVVIQERALAIATKEQTAEYQKTLAEYRAAAECRRAER